MTHEEALNVAWHAFYAAYMHALAKPSRSPSRAKNGKRIITSRLAREIRNAREQGMTYPMIAAAFGVHIATAQRYGDDKHMETQRRSEQRKHERMMSDPAYVETLEKKRAYARAYSRKLKEESHASGL